MRLHEVTQDQIDEWAARRAEVGRNKYGDAHLKRYNLVDVMEELLDATNILGLWAERMKAEGVANNPGMLGDPEGVLRCMEGVVAGLDRAISGLIALDKHFPDHLCTDEEGGQRVWWRQNNDL